MNEQEYYYNSDYVTIWGEVKDQPDMVIVKNSSGYGELSVARRSQLVKKEDSWSYKEANRRADELRAITAKAEEKFDALVDKLVDQACKALAMRMKMNILFGKASGNKEWAMIVSEELEKLIKEEAKDVVKDKTDSL